MKFSAAFVALACALLSIASPIPEAQPENDSVSDPSFEVPKPWSLTKLQPKLAHIARQVNTAVENKVAAALAAVDPEHARLGTAEVSQFCKEYPDFCEAIAA